MNAIGCVLAMPGTVVTGGLPFVAKPEDVDK